MLTELQLDGLYPLPVLDEGIRLEWDDGAFTMFVFLSRPTADEIRAYREQPIDVLYAGTEEVFFLFHRTAATDWADAPFTPHLLSLANLALLKSLPPANHLKIVAVDKVTRRIFALRRLDLSKDGDHEQIKQRFLAMLGHPFVETAYHTTIDNYYQRFPTALALHQHFVDEILKDELMEETRLRKETGMPLPLILLNRVLEKSRDIVRALEKARPRLSKAWPSWNWFPFIEFVGEFRRFRTDLDVHALQFIATVIRWRQTQGIYRFATETCDAVLQTKLADNIPSQLFQKLPQWCVYIETPNFLYGRDLDTGIVLDGFFAYLDCLSDTTKPHLVLVTMDKTGGYIIHPFDLTQPTIVEAYLSVCREIKKEADEAAVRDMARQLEPLFALLLYLCSKDAEFRDRKLQEQQPANPTAETKGKFAGQTMPANHVERWEVGWRTAKLIREAREANLHLGSRTGRRQKPHIRTPHLHWWRTGRRDDASTWNWTSKWLPPIPVNAATPDDLVPVVYQEN